MAYKDSSNVNEDYRNPLESPLFVDGFKNDETPLDEYNLNLILAGIQRAKADAVQTSSDMDEAINRAVFGVDKTPNDIDDTGPDSSKWSLKNALLQEQMARELMVRHVAGDAEIPSCPNFVDGYENSNTNLRKAIDDEADARQGAIEEEAAIRDTADKKLNQALFGTDDTPELSTTLQSQINDIYGETIPETNNLTLTGMNSEISSINIALDNLEDKNIVSTKPTLTVTVTGMGSFEVGTVVTPTYSTSFDGGKYKYTPSPTGVLVAPFSTGVTKDTQSITFNGVTKTSDNGSFGTFTVKEDTNLTLSATAKYKNTSNVVPVSNLGRPLENNKLESGNAEIKYSGTRTLSGYRMGCFYGTDTNAVGKDTLHLYDIRNKLNGNKKAYTSGDEITFNVPVGTKTIIIACPSSETGPTEVLNTTINAKMTELFGEDKIAKTMIVKGAGDDAGVEYNIWLYKPAESYKQSASLTITLG
jgi:hypothetical protein